MPVQRHQQHLHRPGSPWQNAWIEPFSGRLRDELVNSWRFDPLLEARVIIEDWRLDHNANRPQTTHGELTPTSSPNAGPRPTNPEPHSDWTTKRPPVAAAVVRHRAQRTALAAIMLYGAITVLVLTDGGASEVQLWLNLIALVVAGLAILAELLVAQHRLRLAL